MRLDLFLKLCCITRRRSEAKCACENGIVTLDGCPAKASRGVQPGRRVGIAFKNRYLEILVLKLPIGNISKSSVGSYYRVVRDEKIM